MRDRRVRVGVMVALVVVALVGWAGSERRGDRSEPGAVGGGSLEQGDAAVGGEPAPGSPVPAQRGAGDAGAAKPDAGGIRLASAASRVIRTANLRLEVGQGALGSSIQKATEVVTRHRGILVASTTSVPDEDGASGVVTFRVPVAAYEQALADLKGLGEYRGERSSSQDVSAEYVDLNAQLTAWKAQQQTYTRLLGQARSVPDVIAIQQQLQQVQVNIERLQGQLNHLEDQTAMSTIVLELAEAGGGSAPGVVGRAWATALSGLQVMAAALIVGVIWLVPLAAAGALVVLVVRLARRQRATPAPRSADG
jgi:hypothetical protein